MPTDGTIQAKTPVQGYRFTAPVTPILASEAGDKIASDSVPNSAIPDPELAIPADFPTPAAVTKTKKFQARYG